MFCLTLQGSPPRSKRHQLSESLPLLHAKRHLPGWNVEEYWPSLASSGYCSWWAQTGAGDHGGHPQMLRCSGKGTAHQRRHCCLVVAVLKCQRHRRSQGCTCCFLTLRSHRWPPLTGSLAGVATKSRNSKGMSTCTSLHPSQYQLKPTLGEMHLGCGVGSCYSVEQTSFVRKHISKGEHYYIH